MIRSEKIRVLQSIQKGQTNIELLLPKEVHFIDKTHGQDEYFIGKKEPSCTRSELDIFINRLAERNRYRNDAIGYHVVIVAADSNPMDDPIID